MRASAFVSLPIQAISVARNEVRQHPSLGVRTKNAKKTTTFLLPIPKLQEQVKDWDIYIRSKLPPSACWFTPLKNQWGELSLTANEPGQHRNQLLNRRLRRLFDKIGLPYQSAHKFRHGNAHWGLSHIETLGEFKALSQNLSHSNMDITDATYSSFSLNERRQIILNLAKNRHVLDRSEPPVVDRTSHSMRTCDIEARDSGIMSHHFE